MGTYYNNKNNINNNNYNNNKDELVTINGITGVLVNKDEIEKWRGPIPLSEYPINVDSNPKIIRKPYTDMPIIRNNQNIYIRYLQPPSPPPPEDILIQQEDQQIFPEPPPIIIRQTAPIQNQSSQEPIIIREAPPKYNHMAQFPIQTTQTTQTITNGRKTVKFFGYNFTIGPRKLIIERPPPPVETPRPIIVERWLAPKQHTRRAIFRGAAKSPTSKSAPPVRNEMFQHQQYQQYDKNSYEEYDNEIRI